ncbi:MAG: PQQ-dependent sugar dehydrogenase, partial [Planctomycetota bacterium]|nr:PQQ-dependent sugar dehydrogenase [Planctomycetota bacterium]
MENNSGSGAVTIVALMVVMAGAILFVNREEHVDPVRTATTSKSPKSEHREADKPGDRDHVQVAESPFGISERVAWTQTRVLGSPDPPPPLRTRVAFPQLQRFHNPTVISSAPGTNRLFVAEQGGKIYSFEPDETVTAADLFLDVSELVKAEIESKPAGPVNGLSAVYGLTFHPDFANNRQCYVCYVVRGKERGQLAGGTRVSRFTVSKDGVPTCDTSSEQIVITWLEGGHNGGCIKFGTDGKLFVSTGDGGFANPPDGLDSGQDLSNLLSCVLRIDVDAPDEGKAYSIPKDNPFVGLDKARGEIWAYGFRNPWKISVDRATGDLWVGDVGWELWELVYRVERGGNYGWSIVEGRQSVHPERKHGPTPILPPTVELPHTDGVSVTGGFVYRGRKFPELVGQYIFGDWETRRIWSVTWDGKKAGPKQDLVPATVRVVGFAETHEGELYVLDYSDGTVHDFFRNEVAAVDAPFPTKLSETGIFASLVDQQPAAGVVEFSVNVEQWMDQALARRFIGVPDSGSITVRDPKSRVTGSMFQRAMDFPLNTVLAKTISIEAERGKPQSARFVETQILHWDGYTFQGYSYAWNDDQTDAELVERRGKDVEFPVVTADGSKTVSKWHFPSRMECARCHNPWAEYTLAFNISQLNRNHDYGD